MRISPWIFEKILNGPNGILWGWAWGKLIHEKAKSQKSRDTFPLSYFSGGPGRSDLPHWQKYGLGHWGLINLHSTNFRQKKELSEANNWLTVLKLDCEKLLISKNSEAKFLGECWDKSLKSFPTCYSQSPLLTDFLPPLPLPPVKWFESGLDCKHCIRKTQVWELSRLCPETQQNCEFGFRTQIILCSVVFKSLQLL